MIKSCDESETGYLQDSRSLLSYMWALGCHISAKPARAAAGNKAEFERHEGMERRKIRKTGKKIRILWPIFLIAFTMTACGRIKGTGDVLENRNEPEQTEDSPQNEEYVEEKENKGTGAISQYAAGLEACDLSGTKLVYEEQKAEGDNEYIYFMTRGLKGLSEKKEGYLDTIILDLDEDGEEELLTFYLQEGSEAYQIKAIVYEYRDGRVIESAVWDFLDNAIGAHCDGGQIRFMLKDNKYICMDSWQSTFVSADGVSIVLDICRYNGTDFEELAEFSFMGSDYYELGKEETELVKQLKLMGFHKTAAAIYDRDMFHLYAADEGVEPLFKINLINSNATGETSWNEMPTAVLRQINAGAMEKEFLLPESNSRILKARELSGLTKAELRIARNEIYARYGWQFESEELAEYFEGKAWYVAGENVDDTVLSDVERANIDLIAELEQKTPGTAETPLVSDMEIEGGTALTSLELSRLSELLRAKDSYGFLQSFYTDIRDVELEPVFYGGADIWDEAFAESVRDAYLKAVGKSEFDTDFMALRESDIDALLKRKTGYGLSDMRGVFSWTYLKEEKAYCMEAGDTNYMEVSVIDGMKTDDGMYYILYENPFLEYTCDNTTCMVTMRRQGDVYQFVSNERR